MGYAVAAALVFFFLWIERYTVVNEAKKEIKKVVDTVEGLASKVDQSVKSDLKTSVSGLKRFL